MFDREPIQSAQDETERNQLVSKYVVMSVKEEVLLRKLMNAHEGKKLKIKLPKA